MLFPPPFFTIILVLYNVQEPLHVKRYIVHDKGQSLSGYVGTIRANPRFEQFKLSKYFMDKRHIFFGNDFTKKRFGSNIPLTNGIRKK